MKFTALNDLKSEKKQFPVYLVLCKEEQERKYLIDEIFNHFKKINSNKHLSIIYLNKGTFSQKIFLEKCGSFSLFSDDEWIYLEDVDKFSSENLSFLGKEIGTVSPKIRVVCSASSLSSSSNFFKAVDLSGAVLQVAEEKPWEKKKILAEWTIQEAIKNGKKLSLPTAQKIVDSVGLDRQLLKSELDKTACFIGERAEITLEDFKRVGSFASHQTLFQLGEEIFQRSVNPALTTLSNLLLEGTSVFPLIAHLRTQFVQAEEILHHYKKGGKEEVASHFPYLKGTLLQKKIDLLLSYGSDSIEQGLIDIYDAELKLRNESIPPEFTIERLLIDLML